MKRKTIYINLIIVLFLTLNIACFCARDSIFIVKKNIVKINPFYIVYMGLDLFYERKINNKFTLESNFSMYKYYQNNSNNPSFINAEYTRITFRESLRYFIFNKYFKKDVPNGFYLAPSICYVYFNENYKNILNQVHSFKFSGLIGYQFRLNEYWFFDIYSGVEVFIPTFSFTTLNNNKINQSILPTLSMSFGVGF